MHSRTLVVNDSSLAFPFMPLFLVQRDTCACHVPLVPSILLYLQLCDYGKHESGHTSYKSTTYLHPGRRACLMVLTLAVGGTFILEQPGSSLMMRHPAMKWVSEQVEVPLLVLTYCFCSAVLPIINLNTSKQVYCSIVEN